MEWCKRVAVSRVVVTFYMMMYSPLLGSIMLQHTHACHTLRTSWRITDDSLLPRATPQNNKGLALSKFFSHLRRKMGGDTQHGSQANDAAEGIGVYGGTHHARCGGGKMSVCMV